MSKDQPPRDVRCVVACRNANGEPDLFFCKIHCTTEQYIRGNHYTRAKLVAEEEGYEPKLVWDEFDPAFTAMSNVNQVVWDAIPLSNIVGVKH
jgi:hypothetical protein